MVLPGHPDKFCDQIADEVVAECVAVDPEAYAQIEVGAWSDQVWLSGGLCTRTPLPADLEAIVRRVGTRIGYAGGNWIDAARYQVQCTVCVEVGDPRRWSAAVNDQSIVVGWAGYDARTRFLPPEHFLAHALREALTTACRGGRALEGQGPDGKLLVRLREMEGDWRLEHVLVTIQHRADSELLEVCRAVERVLRSAYEEVRAADPRWRARWDEVETMVNPNGPLLNGGSDGDNGQTGRKLVMDFYGPRVPIGGGALSGKHLTHVDRIGAYAAREAAVRAVATGASECLVRVVYAPGVSAPLDVNYDLRGRGERLPTAWFDHASLRERYGTALDYASLARGSHFFGPFRWNGGRTTPAPQDVKRDHGPRFMSVPSLVSGSEATR
jgi:S-adenosylmethionine synthetase